MSGSAVDKRYGGVLNRVAAQKEKKAEVGNECSELASMIENTPSLASLLNDASRSTDIKRGVLEDIAKSAGFSDVMVNFVCMVADNGRAAELPGILASVSQMSATEAGGGKAVITTADPMDKWSTIKLEKVLAQFFFPDHPDAEITITENIVDPSIMGGLQVQMEDKFIDLSVRHEWTKIKELLRSAM